MNWCGKCQSTINDCLCEGPLKVRLYELDKAVERLRHFPVELGRKHISRLLDARDALSFYIEQCS